MTLGNDTDTFSAAEATGQESSTSPGAKEQAKQAAEKASEETQHVASVAAGEAQRVAAEAKSQIQQLLNEATSQVEDQSRTQRDRLVGTLQTLTDDLDKMTGASDGIASELVKEAADRARTLTSSLEGREPRELLDDLRSFARRRPGTFLLGALAAGVVAGRLTRGAKDAQSDGSTGSPVPKPSATQPASTHSEYSQRPVADVTERVDPLADPLNDPLLTETSTWPPAADPYATEWTESDRT